MSQLASSPRPAAKIRLQRLSTIVAVVVVLIFVVRLAQLLAVSADTLGTDTAGYFEGGQRLRAGLPLYRSNLDLAREPFTFIYPPPLALLFTVFPSYPAAVWGWAAFSIACWLAALWLIARELRGDLWPRLPAEWRPVLLAALIDFPPALSHLVWGQVQLLLLLLLTGAWLCLRRRREGWAGALIGAAIAFKLFPALVLVPLVAARRWRAAAGAVLSAAAILAVSFVPAGWGQLAYYLTVVLPQVNRVSVTEHIYNHALPVLLRAVIPSAAAASALDWAIRLAVLGAVALGGWRLKDAPDRALSLGMIALVLVPTVVWQHYFVLLYLPLLTALASVSRRRLPWLILAFCLIATASLAYNVPVRLVPAAVCLPIAGTALLLLIQLDQLWRDSLSMRSRTGHSASSERADDRR